MTLPRFYPIFDDLRWFERLIPRGIKLVQLRVKDMEEDELIQQITGAKKICDHYDTILVVNDYWRHAIDQKCDWVHLGQEDLDAADIGAIRTAGIKLGISTHDHAELERAMSFDPDYVALGPVYPTILKKMKWHN